MRLASKLSRARELGVGMVAFRLEQRARRAWSRGSASLTGPRRASRAAAPDWARQDFFLGPADPAFIRGIMEQQFPEVRSAILEEAEAALRGEITLLTGERHAYGPRVAWRADPRVDSPPWPLAHFTTLDPLRLSEPCDIKIPWEVGRGTHLLRMAQAFVLTGEERFAAGASAGILDFLEANPPEFGPQWVTPMEVGLRIIHWIWVDWLCRGSASFSPAARERLYGGVLDAARFIAAFPEREPVSGNHYWFNGLGLWYAGVLGGPRSRGFAERGRAITVSELTRQVHPDGVSFECSTGYHRLVTELMLHAIMLARIERRPVEGSALQQVARMIHFTAATLHPGGRAPHLGDHDDGRVMAFSGRHPLDHRHLLAQGAAVLNDGSLLGEGAAAGDEALWLLGSRAAAALDPPERIPTVGSAGPGVVAFPRAGFYLMREGPLHSVWDAGRLAKPGNGAHGHLDTLSGEVSVGGRVVLADSGTFGYTGDPLRRNLFRGADAHNAPVVDGVPPAVLGEGADLWRFLGDVPCKVERFEARDGSWELEARHEGYRERGIPVTVSRCLLLNGMGPGLRVQDRISGEGSHRVTISWHLGQAAWTPTGEPGVFGARFGGFDVVLGVRPTDIRVSLGSSERSSRWGELFRAPMLFVEIEGPLPLEVETRLAFAKAGGASPGSWPACFPC